MIIYFSVKKNHKFLLTFNWPIETSLFSGYSEILSKKQHHIRLTTSVGSTPSMIPFSGVSEPPWLQISSCVQCIAPIRRQFSSLPLLIFCCHQTTKPCCKCWTILQHGTFCHTSHKFLFESIAFCDKLAQRQRWYWPPTASLVGSMQS